ncbi:MAG: cupin domain-containing protein [Emcibacteraceae bacterium]|nr:cupin domain-containing protein [Emcibacteraceae bacterium]MDG1727184.1 cupin domain-containing protein [Emcibacteraceae bacterium]
MSKTVESLLSFPDEVEFYQNYWNKKPFFVSKGVSEIIINGLISADELAGLSLEEDIRSRIVRSGKTPQDWICEHGPFEETIFSSLPERNWSLLVQDVEKNHPPTADILDPFSFSPCWLIDDVMVSYSTPGGGVGPHLDSYHVFLIQGMGKRSWKIGREKIRKEKYIQGLDLKILSEEFIGDEFEVEPGDVIYVPPFFPHSGETIDESMTYSVGFLGPSMAELLIEFSHYIEEQESLNGRYDGGQLDANSSGENMDESEVNNFRASLTDLIRSDQFEEWLRRYFKNED